MMPEWTSTRLKQLALESDGREYCGFITEDWGILHVDNIASRDVDFEFDPQQQLALMNIYGDQIIGVFHTHPGVGADPTETDIACRVDGYRQWIANEHEVNEW